MKLFSVLQAAIINNIWKHSQYHPIQLMGVIWKDLQTPTLIPNLPDYLGHEEPKIPNLWGEN